MPDTRCENCSHFHGHAVGWCKIARTQVAPNNWCHLHEPIPPPKIGVNRSYEAKDKAKRKSDRQRRK
jgi:hypothetical protein